MGSQSRRGSIRSMVLSGEAPISHSRHPGLATPLRAVPRASTPNPGARHPVTPRFQGTIPRTPTVAVPRASTPNPGARHPVTPTFQRAIPRTPTFGLTYVHKNYLISNSLTGVCWLPNLQNLLGADISKCVHLRHFATPTEGLPISAPDHKPATRLYPKIINRFFVEYQLIILGLSIE